jgi:hypothetical protein
VLRWIASLQLATVSMLGSCNLQPAKQLSSVEN